jgi:hypothetical protein
LRKRAAKAAGEKKRMEALMNKVMAKAVLKEYKLEEKKEEKSSTSEGKRSCQRLERRGKRKRVLPPFLVLLPPKLPVLKISRASLLIVINNYFQVLILVPQRMSTAVIISIRFAAKNNN